MKNEQTQVKVNDMKAIKVTLVYGNETPKVSFISFNQFKKSFVEERWQGERRYNKNYTMFGLHHTKTIVTNPHDGTKSVRTFEFPESYEQALNIHNEQTKEEK